MASRSTLPFDSKRVAALFGLEGRVGRLAFVGWHVALLMCVRKAAAVSRTRR